ncbi:nucleotidyltransferase domain-containing protein [Oceanobacillus kimchii]|uniref:nucleotidyltransferase domain-containing protein n=1 Tax=Oceanobacillus kimchii TaxID=746691 RepID=UPI003B02E33C
MPFEQCKYIKTVMSDFNKDWFFAGGWAIDIFLGKETRDHPDIEIGIFREDQIELK